MCREWPFLDLVLKLCPPVLIPRFETQQMLVMLKEDEAFLERVEKVKKQGNVFRFLELGCGSGAIGLAMAKYFQESGVLFEGIMVDIDERAVKLSQFNRKKNNLSKKSITILKQDMLSLLWPQNLQTFHLILSNPPYVSPSSYKSSSVQHQVKKYESKLALIGDEQMNKNGLFYVERIVEAVKGCSEEKRPMLVVEFGGESLIEMGQGIESMVREDYYGRRRFLFWIGGRKGKTQGIY